MKKFIAIIGAEKSGKSTLIRSLTGCPTRSFEGFVEDHTTGKKIFVIASSPQEKDLTRDLNDILNDVVNDPSSLGLVMAIQPTHPKKHLKMEEIFEKVHLTGAFSTFAIVLHPSYRANSPAIDPSDVRTRLGKLSAGVMIITLDGRRFAHLNAIEVQKFAKIP